MSICTEKQLQAVSVIFGDEQGREICNKIKQAADDVMADLLAKVEELSQRVEAQQVAIDELRGSMSEKFFSRNGHKSKGDFSQSIETYAKGLRR